jgi:DNA-binding Lrp family transcriptional regulator
LCIGHVRPCVDGLDLGILRELSRDQVLWFGRLDPRISAAEIARRIHVDRGTVSARLRAWQRTGFLRGHEVVPSPLLFEAGFAGGSVLVDDITAKPRLLADLGLLPGVVGAVDHLGPWIALLYVFESPESLERSRQLLLRLPGVREATPCVPFRAPRPSVEPSALDWRILQALRSAPTSSLESTARTVGISAKTLARRLDRLIHGRAVWYLPLLDFTQYTKATVARFLVVIKPGHDPDSAADLLRRRIPGIAYLVNASASVDAPPDTPPMIDVGVHLASVGQGEDLQATILSMPAVQEVEVLFPRRFHMYPAWFDERIRAAVERTSRSKGKR